MGRHMEEIALKALPRNVEEDSEEDSLSTDRSRRPTTRFRSEGSSQETPMSVDGKRKNLPSNAWLVPTPLLSPRHIGDSGWDAFFDDYKLRKTQKCSACRQAKRKVGESSQDLSARVRQRELMTNSVQFLQCTPYDRDWENNQQKCENCERRNLPCGPSLRYSADPTIWRRAATPENEKEVGSGRATEQPREHLDGSVTASASKVLSIDNQRKNAESMGTTGEAEPSNIGVAQHPPAFPALLANTALDRVDAFGHPNLDYPTVIPLSIHQSSNVPHLSVLFAILLRSQSLKYVLQPTPPFWLIEALWGLQRAYPDDLFKATMRYTAVSTTTDLPIALSSTGLEPPDTKFMYYPRIKCLDCPGKLYTPGPGLGVTNFEVHAKNRLHRQKVEMRKNLEVQTKNKVHREKVEKKPGETVQLPSSPKPEPDEPGTKPQVSSYWSVPEQIEFYDLVRYFGTNWKAIADTMKTKSHIMVCKPGLCSQSNVY